MSEATEPAQEPETKEEDVKEPKPKASMQDLAGRLDDIEGLNQRLLDESKKNKKRAQDAERKLSEHEERQNALERETAEAEGNWKAIADAERQRASKAEQSLDKYQQYMADKIVRDSLRTAALKARARNAGDVLSMIDSGRVDIDDKGGVLNADSLVAELKGNKPYLFEDKSLPAHIDGSSPPSKTPVAPELDGAAIAKLIRSDKPEEQKKGLKLYEQIRKGEWNG